MCILALAFFSAATLGARKGRSHALSALMPVQDLEINRAEKGNPVMSKSTRILFVVATVVLFVLAAIGTGAAQQPQAGSHQVMDQAAIQRSRAVQTELARIEANKEAFIDELFGRWAPYLDPMVYDLWGSLKPIAMAATPWRLLGASLTSDFESGLLVLQGAVGPGRYVGAYVEGRQPLLGSATVQAEASVPGLGAASAGPGYIFGPIAPCRIVDTRGTGARTGMIMPGAPRTFDLSAFGLVEGQGGETGCPGMPTYTPVAAAVNITVTGYSGNGHLTVFPYGGAMPATSFMNFSTSVYALANAGTVSGCNACVDSIHVAVSTPTHVIIDIMGYYALETGYATGAVTRLTGLTKVLPAYGYAEAEGGTCPAGTVLIGGGSVNDDFTGGSLVSNHSDSASRTYWWESQSNFTSTPRTFWVTSYCMDVK